MNRRFCNGMVHVIREGETLYQLSRRYRIPVALLLRANPYVDVYNLQIGQEICIPMVRRRNGMICMPAPEMNDGGGPRPPRQMEEAAEANADITEVDMGRDMPEEESDDMPELDDMPERMRKNDDDDKDDDRDDVEVLVTAGNPSLGDILERYGIDWDEFVRKNDLRKIVLLDDITIYIPKKK